MNRVAHAPNLPVLALGERELDPGMVPLLAQDERFGRFRPIAVVELHPVSKRIELLHIEMALKLHRIDLGHPGYGTEKRVDHVAIIGRQQSTTGVVIETADGHDTLRDPSEHVGDRRPTLGVIEGGHHLTRLVNEIVDRLLRHEPFSVDFDAVLVRIDLGAQLGHDAPIDAYPPRQDELLGSAPRGHPCTSQHLLKSFHRRSLAPPISNATRTMSVS